MIVVVRSNRLCIRSVALIALLTVLAGTGRAQAQTTRHAVSKDGTRIAFDTTGTGPFLVLLHGGGQNRRSWHDAGYVKRLASEFTVITVDMRGNGDSDKPTDATAYAIDRLMEDLLAVADAAGASRFHLWGFSYGANIGRYLAVRSDRVRSMVYIGIPFGAAAQGVFEQTIRQMREKWTPVIEADRAGRLDAGTLSDADRATWSRGTVPLWLAWLGAMLDYPAVEPGDLRCPTLWVVGTANTGAMPSVEEYRSRLSGTRVKLQLLDGLTHPQEFERVELLFDAAAPFARAAERGTLGSPPDLLHPQVELTTK